MDLEYFKESKNGVTVTVTDDPCPVDPREVWAYDFYADLVDAKTQFPVFFIAAWHRRYELSYRLPFQLKTWMISMSSCIPNVIIQKVIGNFYLCICMNMEASLFH